MSKPIDQDREAFETACQRVGFSRPGNFDPRTGTYVDPLIRGRFEGFFIARAVQPASVAVPDVVRGTLYEVAHQLQSASRAKTKAVSTTLMAPHRKYELKDAQSASAIAADRLIEMADALSAAPHPVSGEQKPVTEFSQDISKGAQAWMQLLGNFGPTVHSDKRELKGYTLDGDGDSVKTYYDSGELRDLASSCIEVADWLDRRARQGERPS